VYWTRDTADTIRGDFNTATGIMTPDTLAPNIENALPVPDEVAQGSAVQFMGTAWDNDTLLDFDAVLKRQGATDSIVVPLSERVSDIDYRGSWTVTADTALWHYYYRTEDMWENVSTFPDTGVFSFYTTGWNNASDFIVYLSSFGVSVFPNPFNSVARISYTVPHTGRVSVQVFDVMGRLAGTLISGNVTSGEHEVLFDGKGLASGIYFVRVQAGERAIVQKIVMMK